MIAIIDYGMGNLRSVQKALEKSGADAVITQNPDDISKAAKVVLPGVGAMQPAMDKLSELDLIPAIKDAAVSKPFLGICLGYQLLFDTSSEGGATKGLGILKGQVERFKTLKVPHMGWNNLEIKQPQNPLMKGIESGADVYFCHSYYVRPEDPSAVLTATDYGVTFASSVHKDNVYALQFHPEKSQKVGLMILKNFVSL